MATTIPSFPPGHRTMPYFDIARTFGPLTELAEMQGTEVAAAEAARLLWTEVDADEGTLLTSGWSYVNRLRYFRATLPLPAGVEITEAPDRSDVVTCPACGEDNRDPDMVCVYCDAPLRDAEA